MNCRLFCIVCDESRSAVPRRLTFTLWAAFGLAAMLPASQAQIVADGGAPATQQPTVLNAGNGVPLVNIQTPSAAGVSRNTYSRFDVQRQGAILNNARTNALTQLGGWVQGNPWLAGGTARVILNQRQPRHAYHRRAHRQRRQPRRLSRRTRQGHRAGQRARCLRRRLH